jgi:predicted nucleic acid-binding protein
MKAFDTDILTESLIGNPAYAERLAGVPPDEQVVPIMVVEEIIRGRLNVIRQAEAGKARVSIEGLSAFRSDARRHPRAASPFAHPAGRSAGEAMAESDNSSLLTGGNSQIAKADGDAPVQAYIAGMSGRK